MPLVSLGCGLLPGPEDLTPKYMSFRRRISEEISNRFRIAISIICGYRLPFVKGDLLGLLRLMGSTLFNAPITNPKPVGLRVHPIATIHQFPFSFAPYGRNELGSNMKNTVGKTRQRVYWRGIFGGITL